MDYEKESVRKTMARQFPAHEIAAVWALFCIVYLLL